MIGTRASHLETGRGQGLWDYWLHGEGSGWRTSPEPWSALHRALMEHAVIKGTLPVEQVDGLTTNLYVAAFHKGPRSSDIGGAAHILVPSKAKEKMKKMTTPAAAQPEPADDSRFAAELSRILSGLNPDEVAALADLVEGANQEGAQQ